MNDLPALVCKVIGHDWLRGSAQDWLNPCKRCKFHPPIVVVAGNYAQYISWLDEVKLTKKDATYVWKPTDLYGLRDVDFVWVGTCYENPLYKQLLPTEWRKYSYDRSKH